MTNKPDPKALADELEFNCERSASNHPDCKTMGDWLCQKCQAATLIREQAAQNKVLLDALKRVKTLEGLTLLGCSVHDDSPDWLEGDQSTERAHQLGAFRAFNQAAAMAEQALAELLAENIKQNEYINHVHAVGEACEAEISQLHAALERIKEAAWHHRECPMWESGAQCDCGLDEALNND